MDIVVLRSLRVCARRGPAGLPRGPNKVTGPPPVFVDGAVAAGGKILHVMPARLLRMIEGIDQAASFQRYLCYSIHGCRRLDAGQLIQSRRYVIYVAELRTNASGTFDSFWPGDHQG